MEGKKKKKKQKTLKSGEYKKDGVTVRLHTFDAVVADIPELAGLFEPGLEPHSEIEEQFEIQYVPDDLHIISIDGVKDMTQAYVWLQPPSVSDKPPKPIKVRIRAFANHEPNVSITYRAVRKVAVEKGIDQEYEHDISQAAFAQLNERRSGMRVDKTRFYIPHNYIERTKKGDTIHTCQIHLDVFRSVEGTPVRFVRAEIEFPTTESRNFFLADQKKRLPDWIGRKVDKEKERVHASTYIALHGLPITNGADVRGVDELYAALNGTKFGV